ncbi:chymotrypsin-2-like [Anthonomus grandis grandis]|uniref:chymotrypsin-2-like n=1 Tax=Anthonomus grandis grandis TaxID=2921223 RepID=UPI0021650FA7|nr:chymotrypsin-2-like [Anthonomus grandis grandis]
MVQRLILIFGLCTLASALLRVPGENFDPQFRIMKGEISFVPYYVYLELAYRSKEGRIRAFICGGSLISERHVLTTAHCVINNALQCQRVFYILAHFGIQRQNDNTERRTILAEDVHEHEKYDCNPAYYDVAVLVLKEKVEYSTYIKPVELPGPGLTTLMLENQKAIVTGFGKDENGVFPTYLKSTNVTIQPRPFCAKYKVPTDHICTDLKDHRGDCGGDSGGPVVINNTVIGLISYGPNTNKQVACEKDTYSAYTSVIAYTSWIKKQMQAHAG